MNYIIQNATLIDSSHPLHNQQVHIVIENGVIQNISQNPIHSSDHEIISFENLHVSLGWMDSSVSFGEPGFEDRETLANGLSVAAKSGFTHVALNPSNSPVTDNVTVVKYLLNQSQGFATTLLPIGACTKNEEGIDLAEMYDMHKGGAIAFGDYKKSFTNANLLKIALQYVQDFDGKVIAFANDSSIKGKGVVHEGIVSTQLGLKGIPALAEEVVIARNLYILEYTGGNLHIPTISTKGSVELVREAKAKGLQVTCSVAVHNLALTDDVLHNFDTRYKVFPPIRDKNHQEALLNAVLDGTIDCITSDHYPLDIEHKKMEFDLAKDGTIGLESAFGILNTFLPLDVIIEKLTAAKRIFINEKSSIEMNKPASLTLFTPEGETIFTKANILSKSKNSAFLNQTMKGKVYGIINNGTWIKN